MVYDVTTESTFATTAAARLLARGWYLDAT
jgi:hypothetical protein